MKILCRLFLTLVLILLLKTVLFGQDNPIIFFEIIKGDSVKLFFNERYKFVEKGCLDFIRYVKIDSTGNFNGYFEDVNNENLILSKGCYIHGKKNGYFEINYQSGKINCKGNYKENIPIGQWDFFYKNGLPERTIKFTDKDTLLVKFNDENGNLNVIDGIGEFNGYVAGLSNSSESIVAKGKVVNGKPFGKWSSTLKSNKIFCKEEFEGGKLIRGVFPNALIEGRKVYTDKSFLNTFFLGNYLGSLENFLFEKCSDSSNYTTEIYSFDMVNFKTELQWKIEQVFKEDHKTGNIGDYVIGEKYLTIQFSVNNDGKPTEFVLLSGWGQQYFNSITSTIKMHTKFHPQNKTMFFHYKMDFPGGPFYHYNFLFSTNKTFN